MNVFYVSRSTEFRAIVTAIALLVAFSQVAHPAPVALFSEGDRIIAVNPANGQRWIASGYPLRSLGYVAVDPAKGDLLVTETDGVEAVLVRVSPTTGLVRKVSGRGLGTGPQLFGVGGVAIEASGKMLISDTSAGLIRIDPATGNRTVFSSSTVGSGRQFQSPAAIAIEGNGQVLVTNYGGDFLTRVDPLTGNRVIISGDPFGSNVGTGPPLDRTRGIALGLDGTIFVVTMASASTGGSSYPHVFRIDKATGNRTDLGAIHEDFENGDVFGLAVGQDGRVLAANAEV
jgi:DNA-binding beta-propeller fold protein YncE